MWLLRCLIQASCTTATKNSRRMARKGDCGILDSCRHEEGQCANAPTASKRSLHVWPHVLVWKRCTGWPFKLCSKCWRNIMLNGCLKWLFGERGMRGVVDLETGFHIMIRWSLRGEVYGCDPGSLEIVMLCILGFPCVMVKAMVDVESDGCSSHRLASEQNWASNGSSIRLNGRWNDKAKALTWNARICDVLLYDWYVARKVWA